MTRNCRDPPERARERQHCDTSGNFPHFTDKRLFPAHSMSSTQFVARDNSGSGGLTPAAVPHVPQGGLHHPGLTVGDALGPSSPAHYATSNRLHFAGGVAATADSFGSPAETRGDDATSIALLAERRTRAWEARRRDVKSLQGFSFQLPERTSTVEVERQLHSPTERSCASSLCSPTGHVATTATQYSPDLVVGARPSSPILPRQSQFAGSGMTASRVPVSQYSTTTGRDFALPNSPFFCDS